jgi:hypothetical protein
MLHFATNGVVTAYQAPFCHQVVRCGGEGEGVTPMVSSPIATQSCSLPPRTAGTQNTCKHDAAQTTLDQLSNTAFAAEWCNQLRAAPPAALSTPILHVEHCAGAYASGPLQTSAVTAGSAPVSGACTLMICCSARWGCAHWCLARWGCAHRSVCGSEQHTVARCGPVRAVPLPHQQVSHKTERWYL